MESAAKKFTDWWIDFFRCIIIIMQLLLECEPCTACYDCLGFRQICIYIVMQLKGVL